MFGTNALPRIWRICKQNPRRWREIWELEEASGPRQGVGKQKKTACKYSQAVQLGEIGSIRAWKSLFQNYLVSGFFPVLSPDFTTPMDISNFSPKGEILGKGRAGPINVCLKIGLCFFLDLCLTNHWNRFSHLLHGDNNNIYLIY